MGYLNTPIGPALSLAPVVSKGTTGLAYLSNQAAGSGIGLGIYPNGVSWLTNTPMRLLSVHASVIVRGTTLAAATGVIRLYLVDSHSSTAELLLLLASETAVSHQALSWAAPLALEESPANTTGLSPTDAWQVTADITNLVGTTQTYDITCQLRYIPQTYNS